MLGYCLPRPPGGGGTLVDLTLIAETLGRYAAEFVSPFFVDTASSLIIAQAGSPPHKESQLPAQTGDGTRFAFALTDPDAGSEAGTPRPGRWKRTVSSC